MAKTIFISGIDTGTGKTLVTAGLMRALRAGGKEVYGMKPVASGCKMVDGSLVSDDALVIQANGSHVLPYVTINPIALENPCSPNIAAKLEYRETDVNVVMSAYGDMPETADYILIEGIGGWRTPFCSNAGSVDFVKTLGIPVILVVGLRLGCINHALLTLGAIQQDGIQLAGWVVSVTDPDFNYSEETLDYLKDTMPAPLLAHIPFLSRIDLDRVGTCFDINLLQ
jgi:dethiobiotin synthetase